MNISRRSVLGSILLAAAFGPGLAIADSPAQKQTDTLIYLHAIEPASLFQWWTQATYPKREILDSLVYLDEKGKLHPWLATRWSQKGTVWTFKLREDVTFIDGSRLDAATVAKNFDFWKKLSTSVPDSYFKEAKVVDQYTVEFHTTHPQPYLRLRDWKLQEAIIAAHGEATPAARKAKFVALQKQISDEALAIGFYASAYNVVQQKYLQGLLHNNDAPWFYEVKKN
ncbi:ABC transporter substrate-binding protein [Herbaspirillum huttiense]|uniref:ABC transporter substrate-binding protein n=1 Tax=Herbaspirillum huttiense TaxID=863372 RepID=UPI0031D01F53